jgi:hypothetical protein
MRQVTRQTGVWIQIGPISHRMVMAGEAQAVSTSGFRSLVCHSNLVVLTGPQEGKSDEYSLNLNYRIIQREEIKIMYLLLLGLV